MSYPPPPGPQGPPPQNPAGQNPVGQNPGGQNPIGQNPGWQQPTYQPQGGNWAAPPYGTPPPKNRAGVIIFLIVVLVAVILGIVGFVTYRLTSGGSDSGGSAPAAPPASTAPSKVPTKAAPSKPVASKPVPSKTAPSKPLATEPASGTKQAAFALAGRFVAALNADDTDAAVALTCRVTQEIVPALISNWIKPPTKLAVTNEVVGQDPFVVPISGTTNGQRMGGMVIVQGACVQVFNLERS